MNQKALNTLIIRLRICVIVFTLTILSLLLFSFSISEDLFKQLGIGKTEANQKISASLLGGYLNTYGLKNVKNIMPGNRAEVAKSLLDYTRQYTGSEEFKTIYSDLRQKKKPLPYHIQTPQEMRDEMVISYKKSISDMEEAASKADAKNRKIFEDVAAETRKQLKDIQVPGNALIANYAGSYNEMLESASQSYNRQISEWENEYPENGLLFVKMRLKNFLDETRGVDYDAALTVRYGKKIFVNRVYESKSKNWKMAFRAGREVVEPARAYISEWINEIK